MVVPFEHTQNAQFVASRYRIELSQYKILYPHLQLPSK